MKKLIPAATMLIIGMAAITASAGTQWTLQNKVYTVDTLFHAQIGPGTTQTNLQLGGAQSLRLFYTTTDLTNPYVDIRAVKAGNKFSQCATPSAQQKQADREGARYFAGVNADFFANNAPCGSTVVDSEVYNAVGNAWCNWYMTADKKPHIGVLGYTGTCTFPDGRTHVVNGINGTRGENGLNIYTLRHNGSTSGTNKYGYEVSIEPLDGATISFTGKGRYKVTSEPAGAGSMAIPAGGYVLSGHYASNSSADYAGAMIRDLHTGDIVTLDLYPSLAGQNITQMASGNPEILRGGVTLDTQGALDHLTSNQPRTAIGFNADGTKLVLMVVDGRSGISVGVVSRVLADIMREVGCTEAMNFDGGGSSALYTTAFGVRNQPSDSRERAVTNTVWCVYTAPDDNNITDIRFTDQIVTLPKYGRYTPTLYAYNQYGLLLDTAFGNATLSCGPELGEISPDGKTLLVTGTGTHKLTATYNGVTTTVPVIVGAGEPSFRLDNVIVDGFRDYYTEVTATIGDLELPLDNRALTWHSDNPGVATVDDNGVIRGISEGTATVTGTVDGFSDAIAVTVQRPSKRYLNIVPDESTTLSTTYIKDATLTPYGDTSFRLGYTITNNRAPKITVNLNKEMYALPDSIAIDFNAGDVTVKNIQVTLKPNGQRPATATADGPFAAGKTHRAMLSIKDFADPDDMAIYPLTLTTIGFSVSGTTNAPHTMDIRSVHGVHTAIPAGEDAVIDILPDSGNPDAANGPIRYYDLNGRRTEPSQPGIYIRMDSNGNATKILKK
ncbi:MAG: phosphodiester glycosidase family protein [Bacteroidales bacterium]|nr:phosphodiester glycosidase family protein [Bacteroidales bacterium]